MYVDLFLRPDSIFAVYFLIRNLDMSGDEISRPIHVIFYGDNFAQWSQAMCSYLKGHKLWLYVSDDLPIPEKVDKETNSAYPFGLRIRKVLIIRSSLGFIMHLLHPLLMNLATLILPKKFGTYLLLGMLDRVVLTTSSSHTNFIRFVMNQVSGLLCIIVS